MLDRKQYLPHIIFWIIIASTNLVAIKLALEYGWAVYFLGFLRVLTIAVFYTGLVKYKGYKLWGANSEQVKYSLCSSVLKSLAVVTSYSALAIMDVSQVAIISGFGPMLALIFIHFLLEHEKVLTRHIAGLIIGFFGMSILILGNNDFQISSPSFIGLILVLISTLASSLMFIFQKKALNAGINPISITATINFFPIIVFLILSMCTGEAMVVPDNNIAIFSFLYLASVCGIGLFFYVRWLISKVDYSYFNSFLYIVKSCTIILATIVLDEKVTLISILAFVLIVIGNRVAKVKAK